MGRITNRTPEQVEAFKAAVKAGKSIKDAKLAAGYSVHVANKGMRGLPDILIREMVNSSKELVKIGRAVTPKDRADLVRGRLIKNVIEGKDDAVASSKLLGQDREINMWQPEHVTGIFMQQVPKGFEDYITIESESVKELPE